jgi:hypothetical protein
MKFVICAQMEGPAVLVGRAVPTATVASKAALSSASAADPLAGNTTVEAREYLPQVLTEVRQLLGELVQCRLGRRAASGARAAASSQLVLRQV